MKALLPVLLCFLVQSAAAQTSRVDERFGFRDLKFGQSLDAKQFTLDSKKNSAGLEQYIRKKEALKLGQAQLKRIAYITVQGRLARVQLESMPNATDAYALVAAAKEAYGAPSETLANGETQINTWDGQRATAETFLFTRRDGTKAELFISDNQQKDFVSKHLSELNRSSDL
jgi:hypothetical protein